MTVIVYSSNTSRSRIIVKDVENIKRESNTIVVIAETGVHKFDVNSIISMEVVNL